MSLIELQVPEQSGGLIPQGGSLTFDPTLIYPNPPSCLERKRASLSARDSARASTIHCGSGSGGVSLRGRWVPKRRGGLIPQDGSLPFYPSVSSPKPPYCLESARSSLTSSTSSSASTSHGCSGGGGVSPSGHQFPEQSGGLFPQYGSLIFEPSVRSPKPPS